MATREHLARALWTLFEPIHAVTYFSEQSREALAAIGLQRYWDGYFAGRSAPVGALAGPPVIAMFSGFAPFLVNRALPAAWSVVTPAQAIEARYVGASETLRALVPDAVIVEEAANALVPLVANLDTVGRPLAAGFAALPLETDPYRRLWQVAGTLREHRGDGHVIALVSLGIAGLTTLVLRAGVDLDATSMKRARGWTDEEWDAEAGRLVELGLLGPDHRIAPAGVDLLNRAEELTNRLATGPLADFTDEELLGVAKKLAPIARAVASLMPQPNPIGMPESWDPWADPDAELVARAPAS
ncbi:MAG TPA: hypothetical protein VHZ98_11540 [Galbitalea sp.]|jgi:hypothetical protein|nr:hypothetical protein [Galbitalea sp.]